MTKNQTIIYIKFDEQLDTINNLDSLRVKDKQN